MIWQLYSYFSGRRSKAAQKVSLAARLKGVPEIECMVRKEGRFSQFFSDADVNEVKAHRLDFILRFEFGIIRGEILTPQSLGFGPFTMETKKNIEGAAWFGRF